MERTECVLVAVLIKQHWTLNLNTDSVPCHILPSICARLGVAAKIA